MISMIRMAASAGMTDFGRDESLGLGDVHKFIRISRPVKQMRRRFHPG
jgi:hypothetical protein